MKIFRPHIAGEEGQNGLQWMILNLRLKKQKSGKDYAQTLNVPNQGTNFPNSGIIRTFVRTLFNVKRRVGANVPCIS